MFKNLTKILTVICTLISFNVYAQPYWTQKAVQCSTPQDLFGMLDKVEGLPVFGAVTIVTADGVKFDQVPLLLYYNQQKDQFQIIELHSSKVACVIGSGGSVSFDTTKMLEDINNNFRNKK